MTNFEHLTEKDLLAYHQGSLEIDKRHEAGRHLLFCPDCRKRLPMPNTEQFWGTFARACDAAFENEKPELSFSQHLQSLWASYSRLALAAGTLFVLMSFSFFVWSGSDNAEFEIASESERKLDFPDLNLQVLPQTTSNANSQMPLDSSADRPRFVTNNRETNTNRKGQTNKNNDRNAEVIPPRQKEQIAETRGVTKESTKKNVVDLVLAAEQDKFVFTWKKVPNAAKYHLYISDEDEILIDEFETQTETSFTLNKPLDPGKTYKWKIILTLENGETHSGPSGKFSMKDLQVKPVKPEKKRIAEVRCVGNSTQALIERRKN